MTSVRIKYVERFKDRHGKVRLYYRLGKGPRTPLRGPEGSPEFWEDYHDAANGIIKSQPIYQRAPSGSMRWLVEQYFKCSAFKEISLGYQKTRRGILDRFCEEHGSKRYNQLQAKHVRKILDSMTDRPGAANNMLKALRQVFKYAVHYDLLEKNPIENVEKLKSRNKHGFHAWTMDEIKQFQERHPIGTKAHLALSLMLFTGQRRSDIVKMGRQYMKNGWISVYQQKTEKALMLPILDELQRVINASPTGDMNFLVTEYNRPFTSNGFGNWFRDRCNEAGLPHCSAHGLRKAAAARLAEMGCSVHEIMAITGHDSISEVTRYTRGVNQQKLANSVRKRIDGQK
ncbi:tyrosine-type recombinase/integrase [Magnetovibrio blakemorei]|uniref:Integrase n=1 Tax=Magnetovibrio blakemorei TaxID=28181 RepID=A0A1E5Q6S7_9PROT|nr:tyrosine-type recombinase/integrase [Magnetovibrio blakemorei]OEJ66570.1 hypothetical protein BEN30_11970 [Magnetovibrio blakemorei]